jgi:hypothetical protein
MRPIAVLLVTMTAALVAAAPPAAMAEDARQAYLRELAHVCKRQVTPELVRLYQEAVKAAEASRNAYGQNSNFHGIRDPYMAYSDCVQGPGMPR